uniref:dUTP diphosphatase n=1 Tax=Myoviridae sp. ctbEa13 TaxID=2825136 RepID=A0A8S5VBC8_9CAUD|nr:MAG TPA: dCTP deaminase dUTPase [Myoviridae sp. ctbEa13]
MKIKLFQKDTKLPVKSHLPDSGFDIFMPCDLKLKALQTKTVGLNIGVMIPEGHAGMLVPRSSIAEKGLLIQTSIIDPDYTGEIHLIVTNCSFKTAKIKKGDRVCSLVAYSVLNPYLEIVEEFQKTDRGAKGLGSTGK